MKTIDKIITEANGKYGAPMGRSNSYPNYPHSIVDIGAKHKYLVDTNTKESKIIFDCYVPMSGYGEYDRGGVYWGLPTNRKGMGPLRVEYTKDLTYINFYRQ